MLCPTLIPSNRCRKGGLTINAPKFYSRRAEHACSGGKAEITDVLAKHLRPGISANALCTIANRRGAWIAMARRSRSGGLNR
jgi:hypothetical protein